MSKLLIAGIDPGTISGYCIMDLNGNIINIGSERDISHGELILKITNHGKIFAIGSDVYPFPNLTAKLAKKIGAKIICPDHDLNYLEKIKIVDTYLKKQEKRININNKHEKDALAAALYGLKRINTLIKKINDHLKENKKEYLFEKVIEKVLVDEIPISKAVELFS